MRKTIARTMVGLTAIMLVAFTLFTLAVIYPWFKAQQVSRLSWDLELAARAVETSGIETFIGPESTKSRITWISSDGTVLYDSQTDASLMSSHKDRTEFREALAYGRGSDQRMSDTLLEETLYQAVRLSDNTVLRVSQSMAGIWAIVLALAPGFALVLILVLAFAAILSSRISRAIVKPLEKLDLDHPLDNQLYDELSVLLVRLDAQNKEIKAQMKRLEELGKEFTSITDSMQEGLIVISDSSKVLSMNKAAMALMEIDAVPKGHDVLELCRSANMANAIDQAHVAGHSSFFMSRSSRQHLVSLSQVDSGIVILTQDITEAYNAQQSRKEFTANVSHELKTPLQAILGSAELMAKGMVSKENIQGFAERIYNETSHLVSLVDDIIRLSSLDEGQAVETEDVDLKDLVEETAALLAPSAFRRNVRVEIKAESYIAHTSRTLLGEIVYNILDNAIRYNKTGGKASVTQKGRTIVIEDNGIGIPYEDQSRVFDRFYRVDKSHSRATGGTGLGLSIVKHACSVLGASLRLESKPGVGTRVTVEL